MHYREPNCCCVSARAGLLTYFFLGFALTVFGAVEGLVHGVNPLSAIPIVALVILLIGFIGTLQDSPGLLKTYFFLHLILLIAQTAAVIVVMNVSTSWKDNILDSCVKGINDGSIKPDSDLIKGKTPKQYCQSTWDSLKIIIYVCLAIFTIVPAVVLHQVRRQYKYLEVSKEQRRFDVEMSQRNQQYGRRQY